MGALSTSLVASIELNTYLYAAVLVSLAWYITTSIRTYWRLRHFKGPTLAAWSHLWYVRAATSGKCHLYLSDVNTTYGPLARIGPNMLLTSDAELYRKTNSARSGYYRSDWYKAFKFGADVDNVFSETDNQRHMDLRKRVAMGYSGKDNPNLEADMDAVIFSLVKSWRERYVSTANERRVMDFAIQMQYLTLDIITALSFGEPFGYVSNDTDLYEYIKTMAANFPSMLFVSAVPVLSRALSTPWIQRKMSPSVKDRVGMGRIKAVSNAIISRRLADIRSGAMAEKAENEAKVTNDMTSSFISHKLTENELTDGALLTILAGSDTVASVVRSGFVSILTQPRIVRTLQAECDAANVPATEIISHARALQLPYLQACIKEALRFNPAATGTHPRVVPPQGDIFQGQFIPGGTLIAQCAWNLHRLDFSTYGPDADMFRPERWIEVVDADGTGNREKLANMEKAIDLAFGYGESKCLGYRIALIELSKIMFELTRRFEFGLVNGFQPMDKNANFGLFIQEGMWVSVEER